MKSQSNQPKPRFWDSKPSLVHNPSEEAWGSKAPSEISPTVASLATHYNGEIASAVNGLEFYGALPVQPLNEAPYHSDADLAASVGAQALNVVGQNQNTPAYASPEDRITLRGDDPTDLGQMAWTAALTEQGSGNA